MRVWIRVLVGGMLGVLLGAVLGESGGDTPAFFLDAARLVGHIGRYILFALVFSNVLVATFEALDNKKMLRIYLQLALYIAIAAAVAVLIGALSVLVLSPERIAIFLEEGSRIEEVAAREILFEVFPTNVFRSFVTPGNILLPIFVAGLVIGAAAYREQQSSGPLVSFFDSMAAVVYRVNSAMIEILGIGLVFVAASFVFSLRAIDDFSIYADLVLLTLFVVLFFVLVVYPLIVYLLCGRESPAKFLLGSAVPAITSFFSGDVFLALGTSKRIGRENLGHERVVGSHAYPIATIFGRVGTAMVTAIAFFVVLRSYSSLEISFAQFVWIVASSFGLSFLLGNVPASGVLVGLSMMSMWYGQGMEEAYLMLLPVAPLLISLGALMDTVTSLVIGNIIAYRERLKREVLMEDFV